MKHGKKRFFWGGSCWRRSAGRFCCPDPGRQLLSDRPERAGGGEKLCGGECGHRLPRRPAGGGGLDEVGGPPGEHPQRQLLPHRNRPGGERREPLPGVRLVSAVYRLKTPFALPRPVLLGGAVFDGEFSLSFWEKGCIMEVRRGKRPLSERKQQADVFQEVRI